jgi:hypothetical protein
MNKIIIKPGFYRLARDVTNPAPDRRMKSDWRKFSTWEAGMEFIAEVDVGIERERAEMGVVGKTPYVRLVLVGHRWHHENIAPHNDAQFAALADALEPCEQSLESMFTELDVRDHFARYLVASGRLDRDTFRQLWADYDADGQAVNGTPFPVRPPLVVKDP